MELFDVAVRSGIVKCQNVTIIKCVREKWKGNFVALLTEQVVDFFYPVDLWNTTGCPDPLRPSCAAKSVHVRYQLMFS